MSRGLFLSAVDAGLPVNLLGASRLDAATASDADSSSL